MKDSRPTPWGVLILGLTLPTVVTWLYFDLFAGSTIGQQAAMVVGKMLQFSLPLAWYVSWRRGNFPKDARRPSWGLAVLFGTAVVISMLALYHGVLASSATFTEVTATVRAKVDSMGFASPVAFVALAGFYTIAHSGLEEYYWRWFVHQACEERLASGPATLLSSVGFMAHHVLVLAHYFGWTSVWTWFLASCVGIGGAVWAWLFRRDAGLRATWLSHAIVDAGIFALGYQMLWGAEVREFFFGRYLAHGNSRLGGYWKDPPIEQPLSAVDRSGLRGGPHLGDDLHPESRWRNSRSHL